MNLSLLGLGILKIFVGVVLILLSLWGLTDWTLKNAEDPYEWEKRMKAIFCDEPSCSDTPTEVEK